MFSTQQIFYFEKIKTFLFKVILYGICVLIIYICYNTYYDTTIVSKDKLPIYLAAFTYIGIIVAYNQISRASDFQRKQFSMSQSNKILEDNKLHRKELSKLYPSYSDKVQKKEPITIEEIHNLICKKDKNGNFGDKPYPLSEGGEQIRSHMVAIMNNYELLAIGVLNNTFDEVIMKEGFTGLVINNYTFYSRYIKHLSETENGFCENFMWLHNRWEKKKLKRKRD